MATPRIGDLIEIQTGRGKAYALYTHQHPEFGALLRVFERAHETRPISLDAIISGSVQFETFFPLKAAVQRRLVEIVGNFAVPSRLSNFPVFRDGVPDPRTKKVKDWWLWDGEKEWMVGGITPEQRKFPIRGVWNDTLLRKRFEQNWTAEDDLR